jgi:hypothetical protein
MAWIESGSKKIVETALHEIAVKTIRQILKSFFLFFISASLLAGKT